MGFNYKSFVLAAVACAALVSGSANAAGYKVLIYGHENSNAALTLQLHDLLDGDARFDLANSGVYDGTFYGVAPTLAFLSQYDTVLFSTNSRPSSIASVGNLLADYVDAGGGVVLSTFTGQVVGDFGSNFGRMSTTGYNPLTSPGANAYQSVSLGTYNAADPLMQGVTTLNARNFNGDFGTALDTGAVLAASWSNGKPLAAYNAAQNVAAVTLFPNVVSYGHASGDYRRLFANALALTAGGGNIGAVPEPTTWAMMIGGFALVGASMRRRKAKVSFA